MVERPLQVKKKRREIGSDKLIDVLNKGLHKGETIDSLIYGKLASVVDHHVMVSVVRVQWE